MNLSSEARLALTAANNSGPEAVDAFRQWQALVDLDHLPGGHYPLLPLICRTLDQNGIDHPWRPRLRGIYRKVWYANRLTLRSVAGVVDALEANNVEPLVVDAAVLAPTVYPELALRPIQPPVLAVRTEDASRAIDILCALGWRAEPEAPHLLSAEYRKWTSGQRFANADQQSLWLGWHVTPTFPCTELDQAIRRPATSLALESTTVRTPCPADQLLTACLNAGNSNLIAFIDAAYLIESGAVAWPRLLELAGRFRLSLSLIDSLTTLDESLNVAVPEAVLADARAIPVSDEERRAQHAAARARAGRSLRARANWLFARYRHILACNGARPGAGSFVAFLQHSNRLSSPWQIPAVITARLVR